MIMKISIATAAAAGAAGDGLISGSLLGASIALMNPAMPQARVLIGSAVYGGVVCGGLLGALIGIAATDSNPELALVRAA